MYFKSLKTLALAFILLSLPSCASRDYSIIIDDDSLKQGGATLFNIDNELPKHPLTATFSGGEVFVIKGENNNTWGIIATDLETKPGSYELRFKRGRREVIKAIEIVGGEYGSENIKLPTGMVKLGTSNTKRVTKEQAALNELWTKSSMEPLWKGPFIMPVKGRVSAEFGLSRIMNNTARPPHSGMDIAAPRGRPVLAANSGIVAFVGEFFFNGKFVVIDHGAGIFTIYAHLSKIRTISGETVEKGAVIGNVGSTGRSTGPHLHFGVKIGRVRVSPAELFELPDNS